MNDAEQSEMMKAVVAEIRSRAKPGMSIGELKAIAYMAEIAPASISGLNTLVDDNPNSRDCLVGLAIALAEVYVNSVRIVLAMYGVTPTEEQVEAIKDAIKIAVDEHVDSVSMAEPLNTFIQ